MGIFKKKSVNQTEFVRYGIDSTQRLFLFLIAINWAFVLGFWVQMFYFPHYISMVLSILLLCYNILLLNIGKIRARRFEDDRLRFTITFATFLTVTASWILYFF